MPGEVISSIRSIDLHLIDDLVDFVRGQGFVLNFSYNSFSDFFGLELKVNIDDPKYAVNGGSKGKRLRYFLQQCDDATAVPPYDRRVCVEDGESRLPGVFQPCSIFCCFLWLASSPAV